MSKTDHSFKVEDAKEYGVECAVLLYNIRHWLDKNVANEKNINDGRVWTYNSTKAFSELFPYLTEKQIYRRLKKLEDAGILLTGNYNKHEYDRTKWYSIDETEYCISQDQKNHSPKSENGNSESGETIPDINTDINTDVNNTTVTAIADDVPSASDSVTWNSSIRIAEHLLDAICDTDPTHRYNSNRPAISSWVKDIDLALRRDGRTEEQMRYVIDAIFYNSHRFENLWDGWKTNILSGGKLRDKFDQIKNQIKSSGQIKDRTRLSEMMEAFD